MGRGNHLFVLCMLLVLFFGSANHAQGAWIESRGMSPRFAAMGGAAAAVADSPLAWYYNPAGLAQIDGPWLQVGLSQMAMTNFTQKDYQTGQSLPSSTPILLSPASGSCFDFGMENFSFGLGGGTVFGGVVRWSDTEGAMRYPAYEQMTIVITYGATAAYKVNSWLMVGGGVHAVALNKLTVRRKIGDGYVGDAARDKARSFLGVPPGESHPIDGLLDVLGLDSYNGHDDGKLELWSDKELPTGIRPYNNFDIDFRNFSYILGVLLRPWSRVRFGLTYREQVNLTYEGQAELQLAEDAKGIINNNPLVSSLITLEDESTRFRMEAAMPRMLVVGVSCQLTDRFLLASDVQWTDWSSAWGRRVVELEGEGIQGESELATNYGCEDTISFRVGAEYLVGKKLSCQAGYWYDPSPIPNRYIATFDVDRHVFSFGVGYKGLFNGRLDVNTLFQYLRLGTRRIDPNESENLGAMKNFESSYNDFPLEMSGDTINVAFMFGLHFGKKALEPDEPIISSPVVN